MIDCSSKDFLKPIFSLVFDFDLFFIRLKKILNYSLSKTGKNTFEYFLFAEYFLCVVKILVLVMLKTSFEILHIIKNKNYLSGISV